MTQSASSLDDAIAVIKLDAMFLCAENALLEKSACDAKGVSHSPYVPTYCTCQRRDRKQSVFPLPNGGKCQCRIHRSLHIGGLGLIRLNSAPHPGCCFHMLRRRILRYAPPHPPVCNCCNHVKPSYTGYTRPAASNAYLPHSLRLMHRAIQDWFFLLLPSVEKTCSKICEVVFLLC